MCSYRPLVLQTGLQKMREPYILCSEYGLGSPNKRFGSRLAHHFGVVFHQIKGRQDIGRNVTVEEGFLY